MKTLKNIITLFQEIELDEVSLFKVDECIEYFEDLEVQEIMKRLDPILLVA